MAADLKCCWFVAAVFREPHDLVSTIAELRANDFSGNRLLVVANHRAADARKALDGSVVGPVPVTGVGENGAVKAPQSLKLSAELRTLLKAMGEVDPVERRSEGGADGPDRESQSQVYAQLRQDVAGGALVLIASVADPDEQLLGARILLRGNCECVLTHEIAAGNA